MDIFVKIWKSLEERLCCIQGSLAALQASESPNATTAAFVRQTTGSTAYADAALLSISITAVSGTVTLNGVTLELGVLEFTAESGALLSGAFTVDCGSSAGVAVVARTFRS